MRITAKVRPGGLKRGVRTEAVYKAMGFKGKDGLDIRDVVGHLSLDAYSGDTTLLLASLYRLFTSYDIGQEHKLTVYDKDGKEILSYARSESSQS